MMLKIAHETRNFLRNGFTLKMNPTGSEFSLATLFTLVGMFGIYCALTAIVPPADDELYGWCWAERLQLSYYDHPPMTAYLIWISTRLFGDSLFAVRLPACLATTFLFGVILYLTRPQRIAWLLAFTPLFSVGAVMVTPDTPLLLFWSAYCLWLVKFHEHLAQTAYEQRSRDLAWWLVGGTILGCGVLGKYTTGLAVPAGFLAFCLAGQWRRWLVGYVLHGVVAFVVASPILLYNIQHDFKPLQFQWWHSMGQTDPSLKRFAEFMGIQIVLFGTLPVVLFPWVIFNARRLCADPRLRICVCLYAFPFAFFVYKAARGPLEGNWALASFVAFWPLAAAWYETVRAKRFWRIAMPLSFVLPILASLAMLVHVVHPLSLISPRQDRVTRQAEKMIVAEQIAATVAARSDRLPVYADTYQWVALLRFHGVDARQIAGVTRPSHFTQTPEQITDTDHALVVWEGLTPPNLTVGFAPPVCVKQFPLVVRGEHLTTFMLWEYDRTATANRE